MGAAARTKGGEAMRYPKPSTAQSEAAWRATPSLAADPCSLLRAYLETPERVPTGIVPLDEALQGGIKQGALAVIAGNPGAGKTALAIQAAYHAAKSRPVLFVSGELAAKAVCFRLASLWSLENGLPVPYGSAEASAANVRASIPSQFGGAAPQTQADYERLMANDPMAKALLGASRAIGGRLKVIDSIHSAAEACNLAAGLASMSEPPLVFLDYLQVLSRDGAAQGQYEAITAASQGLVDLVRETGLGIVALSSTNRATKADKGPDLEALRGSGQIGFDADTVLFLTADHGQEPQSDSREVVAHIIKSRSGPMAEVALTFYPAYGAFADPSSNPAAFRC